MTDSDLVSITSGYTPGTSVSIKQRRPAMDRAYLRVGPSDIPLGYLYGVRFVGEITPLVEAIREVNQRGTSALVASS